MSRRCNIGGDLLLPPPSGMGRVGMRDVVAVGGIIRHSQCYNNFTMHVRAEIRTFSLLLRRVVGDHVWCHMRLGLICGWVAVACLSSAPSVAAAELWNAKKEVFQQLKQVDQLMAAGSEANAVGLLQQMLHIDPTHDYEWRLLVGRINGPGCYKRLRMHAAERLKASPGDAVGLRELAKAHYFRNEMVEAQQALVTAVQHAPQDPELRIFLGDVNHRLERYGDAARAYRSAIMLQPDYLQHPPTGETAAPDITFTGAELHYAQGVFYYTLGDYGKSQAEYILALKAPDAALFAPMIYYGRGLCYFEQGDIARCRWAFERALVEDNTQQPPERLSQLDLNDIHQTLQSMP